MNTIDGNPIKRIRVDDKVIYKCTVTDQGIIKDTVRTFETDPNDIYDSPFTDKYCDKLGDNPYIRRSKTNLARRSISGSFGMQFGLIHSNEEREFARISIDENVYIAVISIYNNGWLWYLKINIGDSSYNTITQAYNSIGWRYFDYSILYDKTIASYTIQVKLDEYANIITRTNEMQEGDCILRLWEVSDNINNFGAKDLKAQFTDFTGEHFRQILLEQKAKSIQKVCNWTDPEQKVFQEQAKQRYLAKQAAIQAERDAGRLKKSTGDPMLDMKELLEAARERQRNKNKK